jgi:hypothetical protein
MKKGTKVRFRFAGSPVIGIVEGVSDKTGKTLVRGTDGYLYPIDKDNLKKIK